MDEPSTGLDPGARADLWRELTKLRDESNVTILLTTHLMDEAERCDRLGILAEGKLVACDSPEALKDSLGGDIAIIEPMAEQTTGAVTEMISAAGVAGDVTIVDGLVHVELPDDQNAFATVMRELHGKVKSLTIGKPSLEDVFLHLTGYQFE